MPSVVGASRHPKRPNILCGCEALATLRFRHNGSSLYETMRLCKDIPVSKLVHFVQGAGVLNE